MTGTRFRPNQRGIPTRMMDISDGLSSEVLHICTQSQCGAVVDEDKLPIHTDARNFCYKLELDPTATALSGGEDYELLFTVKQADYEKLLTNPDISIIGYMTEPEGKGDHYYQGGGIRTNWWRRGGSMCKGRARIKR